MFLVLLSIHSFVFEDLDLHFLQASVSDPLGISIGAFCGSTAMRECKERTQSRMSQWFFIFWPPGKCRYPNNTRAIVRSAIRLHATHLRAVWSKNWLEPSQKHGITWPGSLILSITEPEWRRTWLLTEVTLWGRLLIGTYYERDLSWVRLCI